MREQLGGKGLRFTDQERRLLALAAKKVGGKGLSRIETRVAMCTGSPSRPSGRFKTATGGFQGEKCYDIGDGGR